MSGIMRRRPSPSMMVALLALFVALGGTAFAVALPRNSVGSKQIKRKAVKRSDIGTRAVGKRQLGRRAVTRSRLGLRAVTSSRVGNNALTGKNILESSLGTVPSATSATSADMVDGFHAARINFRAPLNTGNTEILNLGGLTLTASCDGARTITVNAGTKVNDAIIHLGTVNFRVPEAGADDDSSSFYGEDDDFDAGQTVNVVPTLPNNNQGTLTYSTPGGSIVTVTYLSEDTLPGGLGSTADCFFIGTAIYSPA